MRLLCFGNRSIADNGDQPAEQHPGHNIFRDMLLEPRGINVIANTVNVCYGCYVDLERNKLPPFALANNMWIGRVPHCLQRLTVAERLLIAKYLPTAYVVKLYPKQTGSAHWDHSQLYNGLKGCVATYALDPKLVMSMLEGNLLPSLPLILSATIAITFITPAGKVQQPLPDMLRVRRSYVQEALEWLKLHNVLYKDIEISEARLQLLPDDGIPNEILCMIKHSTDMEAVTHEHEGYVPTDATNEIGSQ